jgi:hypothetical protein
MSFQAVESWFTPYSSRDSVSASTYAWILIKNLFSSVEVCTWDSFEETAQFKAGFAKPLSNNYILRYTNQREKS